MLRQFLLSSKENSSFVICEQSAMQMDIDGHQLMENCGRQLFH